jgi:hypothetical protein
MEGYRLTVDLERCEVRDEQGFTAPFEIDAFRRQCLLEGLDDVGLTLRHLSLIEQFEARRPDWMGVAAAAVSYIFRVKQGGPSSALLFSLTTVVITNIM